ncbi:MAG: amidase domain-containing protein [Oscillospiraceae bacterium]|nr:amidase domain-containing protein [Oscillospiraceae bacterium]
MAYNAAAAYAYAHRWAYSRNPRYTSYSNTANGDGTNFVSQCLYAGCGVMNTTSFSGWYYFSRSAVSRSWYDAEALHTFLVTNNGVGPYGYDGSMEQAQPGDVIQLCYYGNTFTTSLLVVANRPDILVAGHDYDTDYRHLDDLYYQKRRLIRITGAKGYAGYYPGGDGGVIYLPPGQPSRPIRPNPPNRPGQPSRPQIPGDLIPLTPTLPVLPDYQTPMPFAEDEE